MPELTAIADRLYALSADSFTDARNAEAKACGDKALAAQVKKLKKPSVSAWGDQPARTPGERPDRLRARAGRVAARSGGGSRR